MTEEKEKGKEEPETFRHHLPALLGSVIGTIASAVLASHLFGSTGTRWALIGGASVSGSASWWGERLIRRSQEIAKAKLAARRLRGRDPDPDETRVIVSAVKKKNRGVHYRTIGLLTLLGAAISFGTVWGLDQLHARQVANLYPVPVVTVTRTPVIRVTTIEPAESSTVTTLRPSRSAVPSPSPDLTPSPSLSPSPSPDLTPDVSPDVTPDLAPGQGSSGIQR